MFRNNRLYSVIKINVFILLPDRGIDKETFLNLGDSSSINAFIPKIGPRVKFRKRLKEYLQVRCFACTFLVTRGYVYLDLLHINHLFWKIISFMQWNSLETCDFVRGKLTEWDLSELIETFEGKSLQ